MKKLIPLLILLFIVAGCQSLYTNVVTITQIRDTAMKAWAASSAAGKSTPKIDAAVVAADAQYRAAASVALKALQAYKAGGDQAAYLNSLNAVRAAVGALLDLIGPIISTTQKQTLTTDLSKASQL